MMVVMLCFSYAAAHGSDGGGDDVGLLDNVVTVFDTGARVSSQGLPE